MSPIKLSDGNFYSTNLFINISICCSRNIFIILSKKIREVNYEKSLEIL